MKPLLNCLLISLIVFVVGCTSGISRKNYDYSKMLNQASDGPWRVAIKFCAKYDRAEVEILGTVKAWDTGFSTECDEEYVLGVFCNEAAIVKADLVNITEEKQPSEWSTCYRAKAQLIRFKDRTKVKNLYSDITYTQPFLGQRAEVNREKNKERMQRAVISGVVGGAVGGAIVPGLN